MASHTDEELQDRSVEIDLDPDRFKSESSRREAVSAAMLVIGLPSGVAMLLVALGGMAAHVDPVSLLIGILIGFVFGAGTVSVTARGIGWFAHYWFYETKMPPRRMATVLALIFNVVIFGWALVFVFSQTAKY